MTDEELIIQYRATGDSACMDELMERYRETVRAKARCYYLSGGSRDDLVQEGMIGLFKAIRDYRPEKNVSFKAFARVCILRQLATALKCSTRSKHRPLNGYVSFYQAIGGDDMEIKDVLEADGLSPEDTVIAKEQFNDLARRIETALSPLEKDVLKWFLRGTSYQGIAAELNVTHKAIDNALQRIRKKLE